MNHMNQSELDAMNRSFTLLEGRKRKLVETRETQILKNRVKKIRDDSIAHLDELQEIAIEKLQQNGIEVFFALNSKEALNTIYNIIGNEKLVAKSKSNTVSEIGFSEFLGEKGVELLETDLGDRIVQFTLNKISSHPIGPASHLKMDDIARIVSKKFNREVKAEPREILNIIREDVLEGLSRCNIGITGANSLAAEDGSLIMVHNEGNITLVSMLDTHIILVGVDKLVKTIEDAISVVKLETIYASGKNVPAYINVISSPSKTADIEQIHLNNMYGARRVIVILLDNGRSEALKECPDCLLCIGCGSCIVSCPIYNVLGCEFGYGRHLGGRGVVFSRFLKDKEICSQSGLYTCTLCGHCTLDCPMEIPINHLIEELRRESVESDICREEHRKIADRIRGKGSPFS